MGISTHLSSIKAVLQASPISLVESEETFNFDAAPASRMDGVYRVEAPEIAAADLGEKGVESTAVKAKYRKEATIEIWVARDLTPAGDRPAAYLTALMFIETIESALVNAFKATAQTTFELRGAQIREYEGDFLVLNITCNLRFYAEY